MIRNPAVAGTFYPASAAKLRALIKSFADEKAEKEDVIGVVSPHAGYIYSGAVAAATLSRVRFRDTFVIMGPNHTGLGQPFSIMTEGEWKTPLGNIPIDAEMAKKILGFSTSLKEDAAAHLQEHSIEVQLPFLQYFKPDVKIVPIVMGAANWNAFHEIGRAISRAITETGRQAIVMASSDMTHYESGESAKKKDSQAIAAILELDEETLLERVEDMQISMCGYGPVATLIVAARELGATGTDLVRYQNSGDITGDQSSVVAYAGIIMKGMSPLVRLAKETVETYVKEGRVPKPLVITPDMKHKAGVFVSIHKLGGLRGCIGTIEPQRETVAEEIITNAISAATRDPRFPPVTADELDELDYSVDVLTNPEPIPDKSHLDPKKYGAIVECGWRRGLLLPDLEGVDTADYQVDICCQKAGISPGEPMKLYRFEVKRYK